MVQSNSDISSTLRRGITSESGVFLIGDGVAAGVKTGIVGFFATAAAWFGYTIYHSGWLRLSTYENIFSSVFGWEILKISAVGAVALGTTGGLIGGYRGRARGGYGGYIETSPRIARQSEPEEETVERVQRSLGDVQHDLMNLTFSQFEEFSIRFVAEVYNYDSWQVIGRPGDEGVDGKLIRRFADRTEEAYLQAKHYAAGVTVGEPDVQKFVGALHGKDCATGFFVTTSGFSEKAVRFATHLKGMNVTLIDARELKKRGEETLAKIISEIETTD